jgi:hypothetical protein
MDSSLIPSSLDIPDSSLADRASVCALLPFREFSTCFSGDVAVDLFRPKHLKPKHYETYQDR